MIGIAKPTLRHCTGKSFFHLSFFCGVELPYSSLAASAHKPKPVVLSI